RTAGGGPSCASPEPGRRLSEGTATMPGAEGARYIELPQDRFPLPPYTLGTTGQRCGFESHGFFCNVDHPEALGELCERMLNEPLGSARHDVRFQPAGDLLLVTVNRYRAT